MRPLPFVLMGAAFAAAPAFAQTASPVGQPMATSTLNERIDGAAGLNSARSPHDTAPLSAPLARGAAVASPTTRAIEKAGSPAGAPLGTGAAPTPSDTDPPTPAAARGDDPRTPS